MEGAPDATLVRLDRNWGVAGGRNRATALGAGRVRLRARQRRRIRRAGHPGARRRARWTRSPTSPPSPAASSCTRPAPRTCPPGAIRPSLLPRAAESFDATTFVGAGHAIRRADFEAAGGYDDALFFCWEEFDFALRAINMGRRIRYRGDIAVRHKVSGEQRFAWSGTRWFHFVRNRLYIEMKYGASWPSLLPRFLAYQVKGARNGVLAQGLRAGPAALRLAGRSARRRAGGAVIG